jgi:hypothetical protein
MARRHAGIRFAAGMPPNLLAGRERLRGRPWRRSEGSGIVTAVDSQA